MNKSWRDPRAPEDNSLSLSLSTLASPPLSVLLFFLHQKTPRPADRQTGRQREQRLERRRFACSLAKRKDEVGVADTILDKRKRDLGPKAYLFDSSFTFGTW